MEALNRQAMRILKLFGNDDVKCVRTTVGPEQEYFLVDKEMYEQRQDLIFTGRTLFGAKASQGAGDWMTTISAPSSPGLPPIWKT